jgi:hypothetical protein
VKISAINATQLVRATTPNPNSNTARKNAVMKNGVGFAIGSFAIAMSRRRNGSAAASAGILRRAFSESGKSFRAANKEAEKKKTPAPAATTRNSRTSIELGVRIQSAAANRVMSRAIAIAGRERRTNATPTAMKLRARTQSQTAADASFFQTQRQMSRSGSKGT